MRGRTVLIATAGLVLVAIIAWIAYGAGRSSGMTSASAKAAGAAPSEVTATVRAVPAKEGTVERTVTAYGNVVPAPGGLHSLSVPFECRIDRLATSEGQAVSKGELLLMVSGSPDAKLALDQARTDARAAETTLKQVRERHDLKLADEAALAQAEAAESDAKARLASLEARNLDSSRPLASPADGPVVRLPYPQGAVVPAGTPLAEVADSKAVEVRLGVEPTEASGLAPGSAVPLRPVDGNGASAIEGRIRAVSPAINPATRLVDVYVTLPAGSHLSLGRYVSGLVTAASAKGLVVPYAAVLPGERGSVLYTLKDARAVRHEVRVVIENGDEALVSAPDVKAGDPVVVSGNYELEGNMAVKVEPAP